MQYVARRGLGLGMAPQPWLAPLRDMFSFVVWSCSFMGNSVSWRRHSFTVDNSGQMILNERKETL